MSSALSAAKSAVFVSGANGRTGALVVERLLRSTDFAPIAIVRSAAGRAQTARRFGDAVRVVVSDVAAVTDDELFDALRGALSETERETGRETHFVLCSSATPALRYASLPGVLLARLWGERRVPEFSFPPRGAPYEVDWLGAKRQIDVAARLGVARFVLLSSMGGTQREHFLNGLGRREGEPYSGNILLWKRRAERHLLTSGLRFTVVHPGGLVDTRSATAKVRMGFDDALLREKEKSVSRDEVAELCVAALRDENAINKSFDVVSVESGERESFVDWAAFFATPGSNSYAEPDPLTEL